MSHHFDTPTAKEAPINVCGFYLFRGRPGTTRMQVRRLGIYPGSPQRTSSNHKTPSGSGIVTKMKSGKLGRGKAR